MVTNATTIVAATETEEGRADSSFGWWLMTGADLF
jgi:hypothetical protein